LIAESSFDGRLSKSVLGAQNDHRMQKKMHKFEYWSEASSSEFLRAKPESRHWQAYQMPQSRRQVCEEKASIQLGNFLYINSSLKHIKNGIKNLNILVSVLGLRCRKA